MSSMEISVFEEKYGNSCNLVVMVSLSIFSGCSRDCFFLEGIPNAPICKSQADAFVHRQVFFVFPSYALDSP
ncbi:hypothetical protein [Desulfobotulus mexicanus]|uniref:hypothetical protein n=1 Tax=Desulfobotulus mexicanus TaxID=2586642 RepID=UPI0015D43F37|nr:hypothetical protein [Desulfobotulus mexicanus]